MFLNSPTSYSIFQLSPFNFSNFLSTQTNVNLKHEQTSNKNRKNKRRMIKPYGGRGGCRATSAVLRWRRIEVEWFELLEVCVSVNAFSLVFSFFVYLSLSLYLCLKQNWTEQWAFSSVYLLPLFFCCYRDGKRERERIKGVFGDFELESDFGKSFGLWTILKAFLHIVFSIRYSKYVIRTIRK